MHLLQSGIDITTIAAWLGHSQLSTTHTYVEIDLRMKQAAIASASALPEIKDVAYPAPDIVDWLEKLSRPRQLCGVKMAKTRPRPRDNPVLDLDSA